MKKSVDQENPIKITVTEQGALIPKELLVGIREVEIRSQQGILLVLPVVEGDPILQLGQAPIVESVEDASINHDRYLYASP